jgi:hypothetical protein
MEKIGLFIISRHINKYFNFLFTRGFKITKRWFYGNLSNWAFKLESPDCIIDIFSELDELHIRLLSKYDDMAFASELRIMVFFLTNRETYIGAYEGRNLWFNYKPYAKSADLLKIYIDHIIPFFGKDINKHKPALQAAQKQYNEKSMEIYMKHKKIRKKNR